MSKHTPGPWMINGYDIIPQGIRKDSTAILARVYHSYNPASNGGAYDLRDLPQEANARLIAAAPEMLETLQFVNSYVGHSCNIEYGNTLGVDRCAKCKILAVIEKVNGGV